MKNFLYHIIQLPFEVVHPTLPKPNKVDICSIHTYDIVDQRLLNLIAGCGCYPFHTEVFGFLPGTTAPIHIDSRVPSNMAKLNFVVGTGVVSWHAPLPAAANKSPELTDIGTPYLMYSPDEVFPLYSTQTTGPSIINAGVPHSFVNNSSEDCWVVSIVLFDPATDDHVQFDEATTKFDQYIIK